MVVRVWLIAACHLSLPMLRVPVSQAVDDNTASRSVMAIEHLPVADNLLVARTLAAAHHDQLIQSSSFANGTLETSTTVPHVRPPGGGSERMPSLVHQPHAWPRRWPIAKHPVPSRLRPATESHRPATDGLAVASRTHAGPVDCPASRLALPLQNLAESHSVYYTLKCRVCQAQRLESCSGRGPLLPPPHLS